MTRKYLRSGTMVEYRGELKNGQYAVSRLYEVDKWDGSDTELVPAEDVILVNELFDVPPREAVDKEIAKLHEELKFLSSKKYDLKLEITKLEIEKKDLFKEFQEVDALKGILEFIHAKKLWYFFPSRYHIGITTSDEERVMGSRYELTDRKKLLTLFGDSNGNLKWKLNQYSDGSGSNEDVVPCNSLEEAEQAAQKHLDSLVPERFGGTDMATIQFAKKHNLKLPDWFIPKFLETQEKDMQRHIEESELTIKRYKEAWEKTVNDLK